MLITVIVHTTSLGSATIPLVFFFLFSHFRPLSVHAYPVVLKHLVEASWERVACKARGSQNLTASHKVFSLEAPGQPWTNPRSCQGCVTQPMQLASDLPQALCHIFILKVQLKNVVQVGHCESGKFELLGFFSSLDATRSFQILVSYSWNKMQAVVQYF